MSHAVPSAGKSSWLPMDHEPRLDQHLPALDAIRGLAIVVVTMYRFYLGPPVEGVISQSFFHFCSLGYRGVDLFFVLSGFLITGILYNAKGESHYFRNFYARRTLRIFPLYYTVLLGALVVLPMMSAGWSEMFRSPIELAPWLWFYGANVQQSLIGDWQLGGFNHFWSLAVEEHFYLVWPFVIYGCSRMTAMRVCWALIVAAPLARIVWLLSGGNDVAVEVNTLLRMDALAWGALCALAVRGPGGVQAMTRYAWRGFLVTGVLVAVWCVFPKRLMSVPESVWGAFFSCVLILVVAARPGSWWHRAWQSRTLRFFGKYSYGMYVFQNLLIPILAPWCTAEILATQLGSNLEGRLVYMALMSLATAGCALASWNVLEKHALKLKRYFEAKKGEQPFPAVNLLAGQPDAPAPTSDDNEIGVVTPNATRGEAAMKASSDQHYFGSI